MSGSSLGLPRSSRPTAPTLTWRETSRDERYRVHFVTWRCGGCGKQAVSTGGCGKQAVSTGATPGRCGCGAK